MPTSPTDPLQKAQRALAAWHATHPDATLAEIEVAVEDQVARLRAHLLTERATAGFEETHPLCGKCGATMQPHSTVKRTLVLQGDQPLELKRRYLVCSSCGEGIFPPG
jgi:YgiT-type zinc finger domain-containing protein